MYNSPSCMMHKGTTIPLKMQMKWIFTQLIFFLQEYRFVYKQPHFLDELNNTLQILNLEPLLLLDQWTWQIKAPRVLRLYIYIYIGIKVRVFTNGPKDKSSIPGLVILND